MKNLKVSWFSTGVSSFIAVYLIRDSIDKIIYTHIDDQHEDSIRFLKDCEKVLGKEIEIIQSRYKTVENVCRTFNFINSPKFAKCTEILKKRVRKEWEYDHRDYNITYVWGFDENELGRAMSLIDDMPNFNHEFPLIEYGLSKQDCHGMLKELGIRRPLMYDLGYHNNNCKGCVKGGMGYWNKIRKDFPEVFASRAKLERDIGIACLCEEKKIDGKRTKIPLFLDQLSPNRGNYQKEIPQECGIMCELNL